MEKKWTSPYVRIRELRDLLGLNLYEMGGLVGVSRSQAGQVETGMRGLSGRAADIAGELWAHVLAKMAGAPSLAALARRYGVQDPAQSAQAEILRRQKLIIRLRARLEKWEDSYRNLLYGLHGTEGFSFSPRVESREIVGQTLSHLRNRQLHRARLFPAGELVRLRARIAALEAEVSVWKDVLQDAP